MKKFILGIIFLFALTSCGSKANSNDEEVMTDSIATDSISADTLVADSTVILEDTILTANEVNE